MYRLLAYSVFLGALPLVACVAPLEGRYDYYQGWREGKVERIETAFEHEGSDVSLRPLARRELLRIAHEALVNVRRHSHASRVVMKLSADLRDLVLSVEDNGQGLAFEGVRSGNELADGSGPRTILERADTIGGELSVWSRPGGGMRLAVRVPLHAVAEQVV